MVDNTNRIMIYPTVFHMTLESWKSGGLGRYQGMSGDQPHQSYVNIYDRIPRLSFDHLVLLVDHRLTKDMAEFVRAEVLGTTYEITQR